MWLQQDILQLFIISTIVGCVLSSPMLYKKKDDNENYERGKKTKRKAFEK